MGRWAGTVEFAFEEFEVRDAAEFKAPPFGNVTGEGTACGLVAE